MDDVRRCLQLGEDACRKVVRKLMDKKLIKPMGRGKKRYHAYILEDKAKDYLL
jgi:hypothetical protein